MDKQGRISSPIWWAVLATVITGIGSDIISILVSGRYVEGSVLHIIISASLFISSGSVFFYRTWLADSVLRELRRDIEGGERRFLWSIHNPNINPNVVADDYNIIANYDEIEQWRKEKIAIIPEKVYSWILKESTNHVVPRFQQKLQLSSVIGVLLALIGTICLLWPMMKPFFVNFLEKITQS